MPKYMSHWSFTEEYARATKRFVLFLAFCSPEFDSSKMAEYLKACAAYRKGILKAAPYLKAKRDNDEVLQGISDEYLWLDFGKNKRKAWDYFYQTVGDEGPTKSNKYKGKHKVYACLYGPHGVLTENT